MRNHSPEVKSFVFRGCVTPVQIQNLNKAIENNLDYLDGYAELDPSLQTVVEKALKEGHVDDSDWRGVKLDRLFNLHETLTFGRMWNKTVRGSRGFVKLLQRKMRPWSRLRYMNHPCIHDLKPSPRLSSAHHIRRTLMEAMLQVDQPRLNASLVKQLKIKTTAILMGDPYPKSRLLLREARTI